MWMGEAAITATARVCNEYDLPKPAEAEATVSSHVHHDVRLYQPTCPGLEGTKSYHPAQGTLMKSPMI